MFFQMKITGSVDINEVFCYGNTSNTCNEGIFIICKAPKNVKFEVRNSTLRGYL
jgi:hypothetical protein